MMKNLILSCFALAAIAVLAVFAHRYLRTRAGRRKSRLDALIRFRDACARVDALSWRRSPPAGEQIELAATLAESFEQMSRSDIYQEQLNIAASQVGKKILSLSGYLAETAINKNDTEIIMLALMMHVAEGFRVDYRESIRYLILIDHAARRLGIKLKPLILSVIALASPQAKKRLKEFSHRTDDLNSLASMGVKEDGPPGEIRFVPA